MRHYAYALCMLTTTKATTPRSPQGGETQGVGNGNTQGQGKRQGQGHGHG